MAWMLLILAGVLEVTWAIGLKYSNGFKNPVASIFTVVTMIASFYCLAKALEYIPVGTGYAVWTGIGAVGTAILGMILFAEPPTPLRGFSILLIVGGIVGLKLAHSWESVDLPATKPPLKHWEDMLEQAQDESQHSAPSGKELS